MKNKITFLLFLLVLVVFYLMSDSVFADFALGTSILMTIFLLGQMFDMRKHLEAEILMSENMITRGNMIRVPVIIKNSGKLPVTWVEAKIRYMDSDGENYKSLKLSGMVEAKGEVQLEAYLKTVNCGITTVYLESVSVTDYFGVFSGKCQSDDTKKEIYVLPWTHVPMAETLAEVGDFAGKYGEDVYETYDIREFRDGDDIRQIHWKLTAKMDVLLVREYLKTSESGVMIRLDMEKKEETLSREQLDSFLDKAASLSWEILKWGVSHFVVWNCGEDEIMLFVASEEQFIEYQMILISTTVCGRDVDTTYLKEKVINEEKVHTIRMDLEGHVYWEDGTEIK